MSEITDSKNKKDHIYFLDHARVTACVLVLLVHVSAVWLDKEPVGSAGAFFVLSCNILAFTGVSLYVMISGALALSKTREAHVHTYIMKSLRLLGLWLLWKVLYRLVDMLELKAAGTAIDWKEDFFIQLVSKPGHYHLWFLTMLAFVYLMVPLIKKGCEKKENCILYIVVFTLVSIFFPTLFLFDFPFRYLLEDFYNIFDVAYFAGYIGYFILGHFLLQHTDKEKKNVVFILLWVAAVVSFVIACVSGSARSFAEGVTCTLFSTPFSIHCILLSMAVFLLFKKVVKTDEAEDRTVLEKQDKKHSIMTQLSVTTLGVYLIHPFILDMMIRAGYFSVLGNVWTGLPVMLLLLTLISFIAALLLRKIPFINKVL